MNESAGTSSCLSVEKVTFSYEKDRPVLRDLCLDAQAGESVGLIGANGAGKSTFLRLLVGLLFPQEGSIRIDGIPVEKASLSGIRKKIGYVFQDADSQLFMTTVREDVAFGPRNYGLSEEDAEKRTVDALEKCRITHLADRPVYRLSGGEKKLAQFATILSMEPEILLLDEPSSALDPRNRRNLISVINELAQIKVIASHDLDFIFDTCRRTVLMD